MIADEMLFGTPNCSVKNNAQHYMSIWFEPCADYNNCWS